MFTIAIIVFFVITMDNSFLEKNSSPLPYRSADWVWFCFAFPNSNLLYLPMVRSRNHETIKKYQSVKSWKVPLK